MLRITLVTKSVIRLRSLPRLKFLLRIYQFDGFKTENRLRFWLSFIYSKFSRSGNDFLIIAIELKMQWQLFTYICRRTSDEKSFRNDTQLVAYLGNRNGCSLAMRRLFFTQRTRTNLFWENFHRELEFSVNSQLCFSLALIIKANYECKNGRTFRI